jgi:hypothetical protein
MDKEVEIITIDNKDYAILKETETDSNTYFYLSNINDSNDIMIRKSSKEDNDLLIPLDNEKEFDLASSLLIKDYID